MKTTPLLLLLVVFAARLSGQTTFVTTIDATTPNAVFVYDTQWLARGFTTGANATGYTLNHVNLFLVTPGSPDPTFAVQLRADAAGQPGALIGAFSTLGGGQFGWSGANLAASTTYWVAATSTAGVNFSTSYAWYYTAASGATTSGGWTADEDVYGSANGGSSWSLSAANNYQYSVTATAVAIPEPATGAVLTGLAMFGMALVRRTRGARLRGTPVG